MDVKNHENISNLRVSERADYSKVRSSLMVASCFIQNLTIKLHPAKVVHAKWREFYHLATKKN